MRSSTLHVFTYKSLCGVPVEVLDPGKAGRPVEGGAVFFKYTITSPQLGDIVMEEKDGTGMKMMWGPAMMCLPEMHSALRKVSSALSP